MADEQLSNRNPDKITPIMRANIDKTLARALTTLEAKTEPNHTALIVIDVQNDFCPGGALAVPDGDAVVPVANHLIEAFDHVLLTQDWHPPDHGSFAAAHPGKQPFETVDMPYGTQILWPVHCVQASPGAGNVTYDRNFLFGSRLRLEARDLLSDEPLIRAMSRPASEQRA